MDRVDAIIVGAGAVGLAIGSEIARKDLDLFIIEKAKTYGQGTSSRSSEVIHAGIYYPKGSLKARLCVEGSSMLYKICEENKIGYKKLGKIIVATDDSSVKGIEQLARQGVENGARDLELIDEDEILMLEPNVKAVAAVYSPWTGIIDSHGLMDYLYRKTRRQSSVDPLILDTEVVGLSRKSDGYLVEMLSSGERFSIETGIVINSAGLYADKIAEMVGIDVDRARYRQHWCKGDYFSLSGKPPVKMLVYPEPPKDGVSLGIHATPDLTGRVRFGPNAYYVKEENYSVESDAEEFFKDIQKYLPMVKRMDLHPDTSGIRAKLQGPGETFRDFIIRHEEDNGFPGLINLIGIESPGLTAAPAIGVMVRNIVEEILK
ncbi:MAG: NAD(P)/FAD-dependent oxidoreductase [Candidatus Bathyarchaeia archaeon]